jgi:hypothetical protein
LWLLTRQVAQQICDCGLVISSSLHGLVFADAFGVPAAWLHHNTSLPSAEEGVLKYIDYFRSTDRSATPVSGLGLALDAASHVPPLRRAVLHRLWRGLVAAFPFQAVCDGGNVATAMARVNALVEARILADGAGG